MTNHLYRIGAAAFAASLAVASLSAMTMTPVSAAEICSASIRGSLGAGYMYFGEDNASNTTDTIKNGPARIDSDGTYITSWTITPGTIAPSINTLALGLTFADGVDAETAYPNLSITLNSIEIDDDTSKTFTFTSPSKLVFDEDYAEISICDATVSTNLIPKETTITDNITITFTVSGLGDASTATTNAAADDTSAITTTTVFETPVVSNDNGEAVALELDTDDDAANPTQTADFGIGAVALGAVAAVALTGITLTMTKRKKK